MNELTKADKYVLARAFMGFPIKGLPTSPIVGLVVNTLDWRNGNHVDLAQRIFRDYMRDVLYTDPETPPTLESTPLVPYEQFENVLTLPEYLIGQYPLYRNALNGLIGKGGCGKSFVGIDIVATIACEKRAVYIAAEAQAVAKLRFNAWAQFHQKRPINLFLWDQPLEMMSDSQVERFIETVGGDVELVVIDTLAHCMTGGDENQTSDMAMFVKHCQRIQQALSCATLVIHHMAKDGTTRGNGHFYNSCDSVLIATKDENVITLYNNHDRGGKNRNREEAEPVKLSLIPYEIGGFPAAVIVPFSQYEDSPRYGLRRTERAILEKLDEFEQGLMIAELVDAKTVKRSTAYDRLPKLVKAGFVRSQGERYLITSEGKKAL